MSKIFTKKIFQDKAAVVLSFVYICRMYIYTSATEWTVLQSQIKYGMKNTGTNSKWTDRKYVKLLKYIIAVAIYLASWIKEVPATSIVFKLDL